jgi:hypothetical protein
MGFLPRASGNCSMNKLYPTQQRRASPIRKTITPKILLTIREKPFQFIPMILYQTSQLTQISLSREAS